MVVLRWDGARVEHLGAGCARLPPRISTLPAFVAHFCGAAAADALSSAAAVVAGIDAPLGFPADFRALLLDPAAPPPAPHPGGACLDNRLAFRETDREIARRFPTKPPLSVSLDKLSNPATVAVHHAYAWTGGAGPTVARTAPPAPGLPTVTEVYPALSKTAPQIRAEACAPYRAYLRGLEPGTHLYDAALAAILALGWAAGDDARLPRLAVTGSAPGEGAIWFPAHADWALPPHRRGA